MRQKCVVIAGQTTAYWEAGSKKAPVVVLIHGLGGDHRGLVPSAQQLKHFRVLVPDLPGYGISAPLSGEHNFVNYAEFLEQFRQKLQLGAIHLVGHSFGAAIALAYTAIYPAHIRRLVLFNPVISRSSAWQIRLGDRFSQLVLQLPALFSRLLLTSRPAVYITDTAIFTSQDRSVRRQILEEDYLNYRRVNRRTLKESLAACRQIETELPLANSQIPTLIVTAKADPLALASDVDRLKRLFAVSEILHVPGGHLFPLEAPRAAGRYLSSFLTRTT